MEGWALNDRGVSYTFGKAVVEGFIQKYDLSLICRAHQVCLHSPTNRLSRMDTYSSAIDAW